MPCWCAVCPPGSGAALGGNTVTFALNLQASCIAVAASPSMSKPIGKGRHVEMSVLHYGILWVGESNEKNTEPVLGAEVTVYQNLQLHHYPMLQPRDKLFSDI